MEDEEIVNQLYVHAVGSLEKVSEKYGSLLHSVSKGILSDDADAEECVNDTYMKIWNTIPPYKPTYLKSFICKIARQISIDRYRCNNRKGCGNNLNVPILDLDYEIVDRHSVEEETDVRALGKIINDFVKELDIENQTLFIRRYVLFESVKDLAKRFDMNESVIGVKLFRTRLKLKKYLEMEGYEVEKI